MTRGSPNDRRIDRHHSSPPDGRMIAIAIHEADLPRTTA